MNAKLHLNLLVAVWALFAVRTLCVLEAMSHPCEPHAASDCSHEEGCQDDPCSQVVARAREAGGTGPSDPTGDLAVSTAPSLAPERDGIVPIASCRTSGDPPRFWRGRPYPPSVLPLLI